MLSLIISQWILGLVAVVFLIYKWSTATYGFFRDQGVPFVKPSPMMGNFGDMIRRKRTFHDILMDTYNDFRGHKYYGMFMFRAPLLVIRDPGLIKLIGVKEFDHFANHRDFIFSDKVEPLMGKGLFMLKDQKWKDMRATLSPAFTGSKMRSMFKLIVECAEEATEILLGEAKLKQQSTHGDKDYVVELKEVFSRCTTDVIASTAFGIRVNSLKERENEFFRMGNKSITFGTLKLIKALFMEKFPNFARFMRITFFEPEVSTFFHSLVLDTMKERTAHGIIRPDMIHLLMEAKRGSLQAEDEPHDADGFATVTESKENSKPGNGKRVWTDGEFTSQCFLFFLAGFESSSTLMCVVAHELAEYRDVQMRLVEEIDEVRERLGDQPLTYEVLQKMTYLDMVISEALRKWPPAVATDRVCTKPFEMVDETTGERIKLNKGDAIWIPIYGLHRDPTYFPNPEVFDPERFSVENRHKIQPFTYLPFGVGPRNCIASRYALMQAKAYLYYLLSSFTFEKAATTVVPLRLIQSGLGIKAEKGFNIMLKPRITNEQ